jgi:hypothetical protein
MLNDAGAFLLPLLEMTGWQRVMVHRYWASHGGLWWTVGWRVDGLGTSRRVIGRQIVRRHHIARLRAL